MYTCVLLKFSPPITRNCLQLLGAQFNISTRPDPIIHTRTTGAAENIIRIETKILVYRAKGGFRAIVHEEGNLLPFALLCRYTERQLLRGQC